MEAKVQSKDGKVKWKNSKKSPSCKEVLGIDGEATEFEWNIFQDFRHWEIFKGSRMIWMSGTLNLTSSQIGSSACQCWTVLIGQEMKMMEFVFRIQKKSRITRRDSCNNTGLFWVQERKRSGMELFFAHLKENEISQPIRWWKDSKTQVIQYSGVSVL